MARKRKSSDKPKKEAPSVAPASEAVAAPAPVLSDPVPEPIAHVDMVTLGVRFLIVAGAMFGAGLIIAMLGTLSMNYMALPNAGQMMVDRGGNEYFLADYSFFYRYTVRTEEDPFGTQTSLFREAGFIPTSVYVYSVSNAMHWIFEWTTTNLQFLVVVPFLVILGGSGLFCLWFLPASWRTQERILYSCVALALAHGILVIMTVMFFALVSGSFSAMYAHPLLVGGQMTGTLLPGFFILLLTNVLYGSLAALVVYFVSLFQAVTAR